MKAPSTAAVMMEGHFSNAIKKLVGDEGHGRDISSWFSESVYTGSWGQSGGCSFLVSGSTRNMLREHGREDMQPALDRLSHESGPQPTRQLQEEACECGRRGPLVRLSGGDARG